MVFAMCSSLVLAAVPSGPPSVRACQVGYLPLESKMVAVVGNATGPAVVKRVKDGVTVLTISCGAAQLDADSGDTIYPLDLSKLTQVGEYVVDVPGVGQSDRFTVSDNVYANPLWLAMRSFTGQRCGIAVDLGPRYSQYHYSACHITAATYDASTGKTGTKSVTGGWHDAGDYGRYIVNAGVSTSMLLWAFEDNRKAIAPLNLSLPDHSKKVPDFLTEIRWNLDWMLGMQDDDGGVFHKETTANHAGFVMPDKDTAELFLIGQEKVPHKVTTATADFAATFAIAARVFKAYDAAYAMRCLTVAERAWKWAEANPDSLYTRNPKGNHTGGYGDDNPRDELLWASAELFKSTGKPEYSRYFLDHYRQYTPLLSATRVPGWAEVSAYAMLTYASSGQKNVDKEAVNEIIKDAIGASEQLMKRAQANGYRIPLGPSDYGWGSNGALANMGWMLEKTGSLSKRADFRQAARECLHYMFGRNTFATSFVTQVGTRWAMNPHHRPSAADGVEQPWPGLLVGGPNAEGKVHPARQWEDVTANYRVNEVAINWNAPLVYLLACEVNQRGVTNLH